ncbi:MAG: Nramp family divalent metal transporter [Bryobacteraceae bacterium]
MNSAAKPAEIKDPYAYNDEDVEEPPVKFLAIMKKTGPGMILAASIVGSGELIATTTFGAEIGYVAMWIIILSCLVKPAIQAEMGRYTIATGETGLASFNLIPGPRWKVNWVVWAWAGMVLLTLFQIGAMFSGVAEVMAMLFPAIPVNAWVLIILVVTLILLYGGGYGRVEKIATIKVGLFTLLTVLCAVVLTRMPQFFSWGEIAEGFQFKLPSHGLATAIAVFGITGVGAAELFMYPYWCVEKGYARSTGKRDGTVAWRRRAHGWIRVMNFDIIASMVVYTVATIAFYLLGAGILHPQGLVPSAKEMIPTLSNMYTQTLGPWALWLFYAGAVATLYSTIFSATAANARVYADFCRLLGLYKTGDYRARVRYRQGFVCFLSVVPVILYLFFQSPVWMVKVGGVAQALMLPVIAIGVIYLRYRRLPAEVRPGAAVTTGLWIASILTVSLMAYYAYLTLN